MSRGVLELPGEDAERRFDLALFIVHPTLKSADITAALGLEAHYTQCAGKPRQTLGGNPLPGTYDDTRWRHVIRHSTANQWFVDALSDLVDRLVARKEFLADVRSMGGTAEIIVGFLGDGYFGDTIRADTLEKMAELGLNLGIECFVVPQS